MANKGRKPPGRMTIRKQYSLEKEITERIARGSARRKGSGIKIDGKIADESRLLREIIKASPLYYLLLEEEELEAAKADELNVKLAQILMPESKPEIVP